MTRSIQDALRKASDIETKEFAQAAEDNYKEKDLRAPVIDISYLGIKTTKDRLIRFIRNKELAFAYNGYSSNNIEFFYGNPNDPFDTDNDEVDRDETRWADADTINRKFYEFCDNIHKKVWLTLIETYGLDNMFTQLVELDFETCMNYYRGNDWDSNEIRDMKVWEKFLHCISNRRETGEYEVLMAGYKSSWRENAMSRLRKLIGTQAQNGASILNNRTSEFNAVDIENFKVGSDDEDDDTDSIIESKKAIDGKTVRIIFKEPIVPDSIKLDGDIYRPIRSGVMKAFPIYAIDLKFRFNQFPTVKAYKNKTCSNSAVHPNISSGSICLGDLKDTDRVTKSEQEMRDGLDIPPLSDFVQTMKMVNLDSAYFGMSQSSHHRIVHPDGDQENKEVDITKHTGLRKLGGF